MVDASFDTLAMTRQLLSRGSTADHAETIREGAANADLAAVQLVQMFNPVSALRESLNGGASS